MKHAGPIAAGQAASPYLGLLLVLALLGAGLATLGTAWQQAAQREKERELLFRGTQLRAAIASYWAAQQPHALPPDLQALLVDARQSPPRHHLRRLYADPYTGRPDWLLLPAETAGLAGVAGVSSRADAPRLARTGAAAAFTTPTANPRQPRVADLHFRFEPPAPAEGPPAAPQEETR